MEPIHFLLSQDGLRDDVTISGYSTRPSVARWWVLSCSANLGSSKCVISTSRKMPISNIATLFPKQPLGPAENRSMGNALGSYFSSTSQRSGSKMLVVKVIFLSQTGIGLFRDVFERSSFERMGMADGLCDASPVTRISGVLAGYRWPRMVQDATTWRKQTGPVADKM